MSKRKTHKFDNFKWLNTNNLVEEGKEPDEETLISKVNLLELE